MGDRFRLGWGRTDARPTSGFRSDARPLGENSPRGGRRPDPEAERRRRLRRGMLVLVATVVFLAGTAAALFGERGFLNVRRSRAELRKLQRQVDDQLDRVLELKAEVRELENDPAAIERIAREQLGYGRKGEVQFLLPKGEEDEEDADRRGRTDDPPDAGSER